MLLKAHGMTCQICVHVRLHMIAIFHSSSAIHLRVCTHVSMYHGVPNKHPWALEITGQNSGVGAYTEKSSVCTSITYTLIVGSSKMGWVLTYAWR